MYINDLHILYYLGFGIIGIIVGQLVDWLNIRMQEYKKILSNDFFKIYLKNFKPKYILMFITAIFYVLILYKYGLTDVRTYEYSIFIPILISAFCIDFKKHIIPNRLTLTLLEVGLVFSFIEGVSDLNIIIDKILGLICGAIIFLCITYIGKWISGKDSIGFGDVKLICSIGLFLGFKNIIAASIIAFAIAGITSIILLLLKKKKANEYIAFGPFIVISSIIMVFIPIEELIALIVGL